MVKKILMPVVFCAFAGLIFSGCTAPKEDEDITLGQNEIVGSIEDNKQNQESMNEDRILKIAMNTEPDNLDPYLSTTSDTEAMMLNVFEGLIGIDEQGYIIPKIADSYEISEDGLTYDFKLRENVFFHNGKALTADDVVFSIKRLSGLDGGPPASSKFASVKEVVALGEYQVQILLNEKDAVFLGKCMAAILPAGYIEQESKPIGTGPYAFVSYNPGQNLKLSLFQDYYDASHKGKIEQVEFLFMPDDNAKLLAIRSGNIDAFDGAAEFIAQLPEDGYDKYHNLSNTVQLLAVNHEQKPFDDVRVRQALNYAINREEISLLITENKGYNIYTTMTPDTFWYYEETEHIYTHDIEKAKDLLKEAGYEDGFDMEIAVASNYLINVNTAQVIANQLEAVNIKTTIKQMEMGVWMQEVYTDADYEATVIGLTGKIDPHDVMNRFHSAFDRNFYNYHNSRYDELVELGYSETDEDRRKEIYNTAQLLLTEDAAAVFIQDPGSDVVCVKGLKGYVSYPISFWDLSKFYFE